MKKLILSLVLVISVTAVFAQKANVSKARNKTLMEVPDFAGAREAILPALQDSTTKDLAETWYVAGNIGYKESDALYQKGLLGMDFDADVKGKAILESYDYFLKAYELDQLPNAKGKVQPKYTKLIKNNFKDYYKTQQHLVAYGAYLFEKKDYEGVLKAFGTYLEIPKLPLLNNEIAIDSNYYKIQYFTGMAASEAGKHDKAIALYNELKSQNYQLVNVYQLLNQEYLTVKDTVSSTKLLKEGFEKFPSEAWFLQSLINSFIFSGKSSEALVYLNTAIEKEPKSAQYQYVKGNLEEALNNFDSSKAAFEKAVELDPKMADAYAGIGRLYYNKAVKVLEVAESTIKDNKLLNVEKKKAEGLFKESIPFFKKAAEVKPEELEYKKTLKSLYYRLQMDNDYNAIAKEISEMK